jgi:hypothetical protein
MKSKKIKAFERERPMQTIIDKAVSLEYGFNPELSKWDQCEKIKDFISYRFNIYVWVVPRSDFMFVPYSQDLRAGSTNRKKYGFCKCHKQAFIEGLLAAIFEIKY